MRPLNLEPQPAPGQRPAPAESQQRAEIYRILATDNEWNFSKHSFSNSLRRNEPRLPAFVPEPLTSPRDALSNPAFRMQASTQGKGAPEGAVGETASYAPVNRYEAPALGDGSTVVAVPQTAESWRKRLPCVRAVTRDISLASALEQCDVFMSGQQNIKARLALSFAASAYTHHRFYYFLQGPAGVGKTTLATRLGDIYNRPVVVIRCDRISSVEELFGYGPNWKSPRPGRITQAIIEGGCTNPVIFLDEIDKIAGEKKEAVLGALNELLSRETVKYFDNFLECNIGTSEASFLCAANSEDVFDRIPWLKSRMGQILPFSGYNFDELRDIFSRHLLTEVNRRQWTSAAPAAMRCNMTITDEARDFLIARYCTATTQNRGVRELKDWLTDLYTGHLLLGTSGRPIDVQWLRAHWAELLPGQPPLSSSEI